MQKGYVVLQTVVLLLIGIAGAGKTSFCHLLFNEPPPTVRTSTPIAQSSIRAVSLTRATVLKKEDVVSWERVSSKKLNTLIADGIKGFQAHGFQQVLSLVEAKLKMKHTALLSLKQSSHKTHDAQSITDHDESGVYSGASSNYCSVQDATATVTNVDQLFEMEPIKELVKLMTCAKGSGEVFKRKWLYLIDSGGQPQFHELLPTFVRHVSAAALFVKLNEALESHPVIKYYNREGVLCGQPYKSSHNHLQTLQNCLQAMQSRNDEHGTSQCPKLFFIGTHRDEENKKESIESKNKLLLETFIQNDAIRENIVYYSLGKYDQLLYPVNAKKPDQADKEVAAEFRRDLMNKCHTLEHKIPIGWFVLEQLLQDLSENGILSLDKCLEVASRLGMDKVQLNAALNYLVKLNIFEFFPKILPKVVFTTSQVLLNKVTELVEYSHSLNFGSTRGVDSTDREFREYGRISLELLKRREFSSHYIQGLFEAEDLLDLWVELLVVAKETDGSFVIPAVLCELSLDSLSEHRLNIHSSEVIPIAVHYPGGLFPSGIFSSLISDLQNKSDWKISTKYKKPVCLYKNCVEFSISGSVTANVTLIYSYDWIELHANVFGEDKQIACLLRDALFSSLKHAEKIQKYNNLVPEIAFFCLCKEGNPSSLHLASPVASGYKFMRCRQDERICTKLTDRHTLWLETIDGI